MAAIEATDGLDARDDGADPDAVDVDVDVDAPATGADGDGASAFDVPSEAPDGAGPCDVAPGGVASAVAGVSLDSPSPAGGAGGPHDAALDTFAACGHGSCALAADSFLPLSTPPPPRAKCPPYHGFLGDADAEAPVGGAGADEGAAAALSPDDVLMMAFLQAAKSSLCKADVLPMLANLVYANHVLHSVPPGYELNVKATSYKKFSVFLQVRGEGRCAAASFAALLSGKTRSR